MPWDGWPHRSAVTRLSLTSARVGGRHPERGQDVGAEGGEPGGVGQGGHEGYLRLRSATCRRSAVGSACPRSSRNSRAVSSSSSAASAAAARSAPATTGPWLASRKRRWLGGRLLGQRLERVVAGRVVRQQGQASDPHHVVGGQRRQHVVRVDVGEAGDRDRVGAVQVDHRAGVRAGAVDSRVQEGLLRRLGARDVAGRSRSMTESASGSRAPRLTPVGRDQDGVAGADREVAGAAEGEACGRTGTRPARRSAVVPSVSAWSVTVTGRAPSMARTRRSSAPKLPDLSSSAKGGSPVVRHHGTPRSASLSTTHGARRRAPGRRHPRSRLRRRRPPCARALTASWARAPRVRSRISEVSGPIAARARSRCSGPAEE